MATKVKSIFLILVPKHHFYYSRKVTMFQEKTILSFQSCALKKPQGGEIHPSQSL